MGKIPKPKLPDLSFFTKMFKSKLVETKVKETTDTLVIKPESKTSFIARIFGRTLYEMWFWKALFFLALIGLVIQPIGMNYLNTKNKERILILDPSGDFILSPSRDLKSTTKIQDYIATLATSALLNRNPNGLDNRILLNQTFTKSSIKLVDKKLDDDSKWFHDRYVHQKAEIEDVDTLKTTETKAYTRVTGQLARTGYFKGQIFTQGMNFTLKLILTKNPSFGSNLKLPMAVTFWQLKLTPLKKKEEAS